MHPVHQISERRILRLINVELERMHKEAVVDYFRRYPGLSVGTEENCGMAHLA
jgi:hypothetical protein